MAEPRHNRGRSKQDYATPRALIIAVKRGLGITDFAYDLAASKENAVAKTFYTKADDALKQEWKGEGWFYLNPPYNHLTPWVKKAYESSQQHDARIAMLLPASVGSNWWRNYVHEEARIWLLNRRIQFVGAPTESPKDHALVLYAPWLDSGYCVWDWANEPSTKLGEPF